MQEKKKARKDHPEDGKVFSRLCLTFPPPRAIISKQAGVLELADEEDSKSFGLITRAGSTPATGTNKGASPSGGRPCCYRLLVVDPPYSVPLAVRNTQLPPSDTAPLSSVSGSSSG